MGEESCCVRDGSVYISFPVVCVRVGGPQSIVYCNVSTSHSHHIGYPPYGGSRGGCRWDTSTSDMLVKLMIYICVLSPYEKQKEIIDIDSVN